MAKQKQDDQPELKFSSYVRTQDVTQKTCRMRWTIGKSGKRWSRISVLAARHDDDDIILYMCVYIISYYIILYHIHFLHCLTIVVLQKTPWNRGSHSIFHELNIYIYLIYISMCVCVCVCVWRYINTMVIQNGQNLTPCQEPLLRIFNETVNYHF